MKETLLTLIISLFVFVNVEAQTPIITPERAQIELEKRGIEEEEFRERLLQKGVDIDNVDANSPSELFRVQKIIEVTLAEFEDERAIEQLIPPVIEPEMEEESENIEETTDEIEDGQIVEEKDSIVIVEDATEVEEENLPDSIEAIQIYGQHLFENKTLELYTQSTGIAPPESYVLGTGDKINISIWGVSQAEFNFEINEEGYIFPSRMPRIYLKGMSLKKAKNLLRRRFAAYYRFLPEEFEANVKQVRNININIWGEAKQIGSFNIPATNTAFNALVAAEGPTGIGSLRNIKLMRSDEEKKVDLYEFMTNPAVQNKLYLHNNDIIYIPVAERRVTIEGAINRSFTYELTGKEQLKKLIEYAGGFKANAYTKTIQVRRIQNNEEVILDANYQKLPAKNQDFELKNGDVIVVKEIPKTFEKYVAIEGAVAFPSQYAITKGMRITDLLAKAVLMKEARKDVAFLQRLNDDNTAKFERINLAEILVNPSSDKNLLLEAEDKLFTYLLERYVDQTTVSISGAIRSPSTYPFDTDENIKVQDLVLLAGGLEKNAAETAYIKRKDLSNEEKIKYIAVNVYDAMLRPDDNSNIILKPMDEIVIYHKEDFDDEYMVSTSGALRNPGSFIYDEDLRISDAIYFSNGLQSEATDFAYVRRTDIKNPKLVQYLQVDLKNVISNPNSADNIKLKPMDVMVVYSKLTYTDEFFINIDGAIRTPGEYKYGESLRLKDILKMAGGLQFSAASNRIDISRVIFSENGPTQTVVSTLTIDEDYNVISGDFALQPFDKIHVRHLAGFELQQSVLIKGEVMFPGIYDLVDKNEKLASIIARAGGLKTEAFLPGAILTRTEGQVGKIVMRLEKALSNTSSRYNYILKNGDVLDIPKSENLVTVNLGATWAEELYPDRLLTDGKVHVSYRPLKRAKWYVKEYAGGISKEKRAKKRLITVEHPNGGLKKSKGLWFICFTPKVRPGSTISVGTKPKKEKKKRERREFNTQEFVTSTLGIISTTLSIIVLANKI